MEVVSIDESSSAVLMVRVLPGKERTPLLWRSRRKSLLFSAEPAAPKML